MLLHTDPLMKSKRKKLAAILALALSALTTGLVPVAGQTDINNKDLPNFHTVHPYLLRGGQPSDSGLKELAQRGVKTIIDLRGRGERTQKEEALANKLGMDYINLPMSDKAPTQEQVDKFTSTVEKGKAENKPVFVHCAHGSDRTGCMVGIWRVQEDGFTYKEAYKEMRKYYFGPQFLRLSGAVKARAAK